MKKDYKSNEPEIFSRVLKAGRRTYFFDVRETKAGDYYLTITESKKSFCEQGNASFEKHKIFLYKEDFENFTSSFQESMDFIIDQKGEEVISEKHVKNYTKTFTIDAESDFFEEDKKSL